LARAKKRILAGEKTVYTKKIAPNPPKKSKSRFLSFAILLLVVASIAVVYRFYISKQRPDIQEHWHKVVSFFIPDSINEAAPVKPGNDSTSIDKARIIPKINPMPADQKYIDIPEMAKKVQLEVLNGCGINGAAAAVANYLRQNQIDVVKTGNSDTGNVRITTIIDRIGKPELLESTADALGIDYIDIKSDIDKRKLVNATIIVGEDYKDKINMEIRNGIEADSQ
jgi:hypothetical protein